MVNWQDSYLGRGSPKSQVRSRRQWIATLFPKQCKEEPSLEVWKSKLLDGQRAHHGVHCLALQLALMVREKTWRPGEAAYSPWSSLWHLKKTQVSRPLASTWRSWAKREVKTSNMSFARTHTGKPGVQSIAGLKWQNSSHSSSFSYGKIVSMKNFHQS